MQGERVPATVTGTRSPAMSRMNENNTRRLARLIHLVRGFGLRAAAALVASLALLVLFANISGEVAERETSAVDERLRAFSQAHRTPALDGFFSAVTWLGGTNVLFVIVGAVAVLLAARRHRRNALLAVVAPLLGALTIVAMKHAFQRERPEGALALGIDSYSFPSGHATASAASLLTIGYVLARERLVPWWSLGVAAVLALLIGASRVYLDVHWATDVAGGWAVGTGLALAGVALYERLSRADRRREERERARERAGRRAADRAAGGGDRRRRARG